MAKKRWNKIDEALNSELENFDELMTGRNIEGEKAEPLPDREIRKIEKILERPFPDRFTQEKLIEEHIKR